MAVVAGGLLGAPGAGEASSHWTDYDDNNNGLIDIRNLAQLNAIRHDLNGNGDATHADYVAAFPNRDTSSGGRMGCPSGTCTGYELRANLNFDTNDDGYVDSSDDYPSWTPINSYITTFNGNGHTIANLTINATNVAPVGLFGNAGTGNPVFENVGLIDVNITANELPGFFFSVGGLVGYLRGTVRTSYVTGTISVSTTGNSDVTSAGGLAGWVGEGGAVTNVPHSRIDASWSAVDVTVTSTSTASGTGAEDAVGSLLGRITSSSNISSALTTSYALGRATSSRSNSSVGGLVGVVSGPRTTVTASYWDTATSRLSSGGGTGQTTTALQTPTGYTGIYSAWNIDLDEVTGSDDPWDFGTGSQYPALKYSSHQLVPQRRMPTDYDADDDGLIEITTLAQLNAVRYDLDGNGDPTSAAYNGAFPNRNRSAIGRMGCQLTDHDNMPSTPDQATCTGYELLNNLDFDTDGDGATYTDTAGTIAVDADDTNNYFKRSRRLDAPGRARRRRRPLHRHFRGQPPHYFHLFINLSTTTATASTLVGLFGDIGKPAGTSPVTPAEPGAVQNVGLVNPYVSNTRTGSAARSPRPHRSAGRAQQRRRRRERQLGRRRLRRRQPDRRRQSGL